MNEDVIINKISIIKRCIVRMREVYSNGNGFKTDFTRQDSVILNLQRACEACIDLSNHVIYCKNLGLPQSSRNGFELLQNNKLIPINLGDNLKNMVGLRNIAVHEYQELNLDIVEFVIVNRLKDLEQFTDIMLKLLSVSKIAK